MLQALLTPPGLRMIVHGRGRRIGEGSLLMCGRVAPHAIAVTQLFVTNQIKIHQGQVAGILNTRWNALLSTYFIEKVLKHF